MSKRKFTTEERRQIADEHIDRNDGIFDAVKFLDEAEDAAHPAHEWFVWDDGAAGYAYRIEQARAFARVRVVQSIPTVSDHTKGGGPKFIKTTAPLTMAREEQGRTRSVRTNTDEGMALAWPRAIRDLESWRNRYAFLFDDEVKAAVETVRDLLQGKQPN